MAESTKPPDGGFVLLLFRCRCGFAANRFTLCSETSLATFLLRQEINDHLTLVKATIKAHVVRTVL